MTAFQAVYGSSILPTRIHKDSSKFIGQAVDAGLICPFERSDKRYSGSRRPHNMIDLLNYTIYCELPTGGWLGEPFNVISSFAFIIVAILVFKFFKRQKHTFFTTSYLY